ncbi:MAG: hypothetical protein NOU37_06230 [Candidatus Brocadiales bacterium]|nr:hypothetical protein [Candidatus Bathyanammoxibius amoris]
MSGRTTKNRNKGRPEGINLEAGVAGSAPAAAGEKLVDAVGEGINLLCAPRERVKCS